MDHSDHIGEALARLIIQRLIGPLCRGTAQKLGHGLTPGGGCPLHLFVEVAIKPKASHVCKCITWLYKRDTPGAVPTR